MNNLIKLEQVVDATHSQYTQYSYDALSRLRRVYSGLTSPLTIYSIDLVAPNGDYSYSATKYSYDLYGRMTQYTDILNNSETYSYFDITDQVYIKTLRNGNTFTFTYDNAGNTTRIVGAKTGKTSTTLNYTYDYTGNILTAGDDTKLITKVYDSMGRCIKQTDDYGSSKYQKEYEYNGGQGDYTVKMAKIINSTRAYEYFQKYEYWDGLLQSAKMINSDLYNSTNHPYNYNITYSYDKNENLKNRDVF